MKRLPLILLCVFVSSNSFSQYNISEYFVDTTIENQIVETDEPAVNAEKFKFHVETGFSFTSFNKEGSVFSNYIQPAWNYRVSPKFSVNFGTILIRQSYSHLPVFYSSQENFTMSGFTNRAIVYAEGVYQISKRISVSGMGYKDITPSSPTGFNPYLFNYLNQGMSMEINYRLTDNMHIGAGITITEGPNYRNHMSPFGSGPGSFPFLNPW